jgi:hypothetical protein
MWTIRTHADSIHCRQNHCATDEAGINATEWITSSDLSAKIILWEIRQRYVDLDALLYVLSPWHQRWCVEAEIRSEGVLRLVRRGSESWVVTTAAKEVNC